MSENNCEVCQKTLVLEEENICAQCGLKETKVENINDVSCGICNTIVEEDSEGITCDRCNSWYHNDCCENPLMEDLYCLLNTAPNNVKWFCDKCIWKTEKWIHSAVKKRNVGIVDEELDNDNNATSSQSQEDFFENEVHTASKRQQENKKIKTGGRRKGNNTNYALQDNYDQTMEPEVNIEIENEAIDLQDKSSDSDDWDPDDYEDDSQSSNSDSDYYDQTMEPEVNIEIQNEVIDLQDGQSSDSTKQQRFNCDLCPKKCYNHDDFVAHKLWHSGDKKPYKCTVCDSSFARKSILKIHSATHSDYKPFVCEICAKRFKIKNKLQIHQKEMHGSEKSHVCGKCGKAFRRKGHLKKHIKVLHTLTDEKGLFPCTKCKAKYSRKTELTKHMRHHTGECPYACTLCEYKAIRRSDLCNHMLTHAGKKTFAGDICGQEVRDAQSLKKQTIIHTGEKPYKYCPENGQTPMWQTQVYPCTKCNAKYYKRAHLTNHMKHHTGERSYACTQTKTMKPQCPEYRPQVFPCTKCDAKFYKKGHLTNHMKHHTGERPEYEQTQIKPKATSQQHQQGPATTIQSIAAPQSYQNPPPLLYAGVPNNNSYYSGGLIPPSFIALQEQNTFF